MSLERYTRRDGLISYSVKFFWHGRCYRRGLGPVSLKVARLAERQARVDAANGTFDQPAPTTPLIPTLAAFAPHFLTLYRTDARPRSWEGYASRIDLHLQPFLGHLRLDEITARVIDQYKTARTKDGVAPRTINGELTTLSCMLSKAVEWGMLPASARAKIRWMRAEERSIRVLTPSEEGRLLLAATPRLRPLIRFGLLTGLRRNELLHLTPDDIDWTRKEVIVTSARAKSWKRRAVPLNRAAIAILRSLQGQPVRHGRVFGYHAINAVYHQAVLRAGLPGVNIHTLRHTFSTRCLEAGMAIHLVMAWLGHSDLKQTQRYAHMTESYGREMIELLGEARGQHQESPSA